MSLVIGSDLQDIIVTGEENDLIFGLDGNDDISGGAGDDDIIGGKGRDTLSGGEGNDTLFGGVPGGQPMPGDNPDTVDFLFGGDGDDLLVSGNSSAVLSGGDGLDTLVGGAGVDDFFSDVNDLGGPDVVQNFHVGTDQLIISGASSDSVVTYDAETGIVSVNGEALFQLDPGLDVDSDDYTIL